MKFLSAFLIFALCLAVSAEQFDALDINSIKPTKEMFKAFHHLHEKEYSLNSQESLNRYRIFKTNVEWCKEENRKLGKTIYGITQFADMTHEEFKEKQLLKPEQFQAGLQEMSKGSTRFLGETDHPNLKEDDWTNYYKEETETQNGRGIDWRYLLVPPKSQGTCGSCWSFSTIASMEAMYNQMKNDGSIRKFSEQYLINCDDKDNGCNGGWPSNTLTWVKNNGVIDEGVLPYEMRQNSCDSHLKYKAEKFLAGHRFYQGHPDQWRNWLQGLAQRPTIVGMDASFNGFMHYRPSQFDPIVPPSCGGLNHAVIAVGYVHENGNDYIMVRNSWGTRWGYGGNFKIPATNCCGITSYGWVPQPRY